MFIIPFRLDNLTITLTICFPTASHPASPILRPHLFEKNKAPLPPKHVAGDEEPLLHSPIKAEFSQQKNYYIKVQDPKQPLPKIEEQQSSIKCEEKKMNKQLYFLNETIPKNRQDLHGLLPRFKKIIEMHIQEITDYQSFAKVYDEDFSKEIAENYSFFDELMEALRKRIKLYKKTKEELIKFIIRRTYHNLKLKKNLLGEKPEYQRLEAFHQKNLATFKSMNIQFLKKEFSNQLFVQLYREFVENLDEQFQKQNEEKIERFAFTLVSCWIEKSTLILMHERKLPWVNTYKWRIKKIAIDLLKEYEGLEDKNIRINKKQ